MVRSLTTSAALLAMAALVGCSEYGFQAPDEGEGTLVLSGLELEGDAAAWGLESLAVTVEAIQVAQSDPADPDSWITVWADDAGWSVDLIGGEASAGLLAALPAGEYPYVFLKLSDEMTYQRSGEGALCDAYDLVGDGAGVASVLSTTDLLAADFGQEVAEGSFTILESPAIAPSEVHAEANDEFFWVIAQTVIIEAGAPTELYLAAAPDSIEPGEACDDAPGKPTFILGDEKDLLEAYRR